MLLKKDSEICKKRDEVISVISSIAPIKVRVVANALITVFWLLGTYPFVMRLLPESMSPIWTMLQIFADCVFLWLGIWTIKNKWDYAILFSFFVISFVSTILVNNSNILVWANGSRLYFGFIFLLPTIRYLLATKKRAIYFINRFDLSLYIFLWIQMPCLIFQFIVFRGGDEGGGSLGNLMSGLISTLIYCISFYLMLRRWDAEKSYVANLLKNWVLIFLLSSTFLNETKISFIFLLMYFFFLIPINRKFIINVLIATPFILLALSGAVYLYSKYSGNNDDFMSLDYLEYYVIGDQAMYDMVENYFDKGEGGAEDQDFQRGVKFIMLPTLMQDQPHGWLIGYGVGQYKGGTVMKPTKFFLRYEWFLLGTVTQLMQPLIEMGALGGLWLIFYTCVLFNWIGKKTGKKNLQMQFFFGLIMLLTYFYAANYINHIYAIIITYLSLLASRWNRVEQTNEWDKMTEE